MILIRTRQKLTKIFWYKYFGAKFTKPVRQGSKSTVLVSPTSFKRKEFSRATYPTRSWSAYPAPVHPCIASLLHPLISFKGHWWQVHPQNLYQKQGCLPWFLPCCVLMCLQCMQRTWHFLHKPCATRPSVTGAGK